jgi:nitrogen fixation protein FixH
MRDTTGDGGDRVPAGGRSLDGRHVLLMLLAFFGVIFAVNGFFLVSALRTHTGVVAVEPYRKGLAYNTRIAADAQQSAMGWIEHLAIRPTGALTLSLTDGSGAAVPGLSIWATVGRPSTGHDDRRAVLHEIEPGHYAADVGALAEGNWFVTLEARAANSDAEPIYRARRRLWLKP